MNRLGPYKQLAILGIVFVVALIVSFFLTSPSLKNPGGATWKNIQPGAATRNTVVQALGQPIKETSTGGYLVDDFTSTSPTRNHRVFFSGQTAVFLREIVSSKDSKTITDIKSSYGEPEYTLYGGDAPQSYFLFVYLKKGLAYVGNPNTGTLLEVWYFTPTTIENFTAQWATGYSLQQPTPGF